jgi:hypothetical protein
MLSNLRLIGEMFKNEQVTGWEFDEFTFDDEAKKAFENLDLNIKLFNYSARINITPNGNHCYIPNHYFLYAIKLQPLVSLLRMHIETFSQVKDSLPTALDFHNLINSSSPSNPIIDRLDEYSRDNFIKLFKTKSERLEAKDIINDGTAGAKKYRSQEDFMCSIILKVLPVPDSSSSALGDLIYAFSRSINSYELLATKYSAYIPHLFSATSGDKLIFMILSSLGWQGKLEVLFGDSSARTIAWGNISDAFLMSTTPAPGNADYVDDPVHYSAKGEFVHIKKGLLAQGSSIDEISDLVSQLWKNTSIDTTNGVYFFRLSSRINSSSINFEGGSNKIFYGAPGTGKSHKIHNGDYQQAEKIITVFHPDTQYSDFVGALKPVMTRGDFGKTNITYQFRPGPFTLALTKAKIYPDTHICLIVEEINRAPAAAVFGEIFQLLDRNENGQSTYKIDAADPDMLSYINEKLRNAGVSELAQLEIPANLSILATMNSSDQAVMPLDTAFKRRWSFEYIEIDFFKDEVPKTDIEIQTHNGRFSIQWPDLAMGINDILIAGGVAEDRLIGPFFLTPKELIDSKSAHSALKGKLFVYLWDDVLRHLGRQKVFSSKYNSFGTLSRAFNDGIPVFSPAVEATIEMRGTKLETN